MVEFDPASLTEERSLWAIFRKSACIGYSRMNAGLTSGVAVALFVYACVTPNSAKDLAAMVRSWSELGITFATQILGFLVAGFTICATLTDKDLFETMAKTDHDCGLSYLKYNFFAFLRVFGSYLLFTGVCLTIVLLAGPGGPVSAVADCLPSRAPQLKSGLARTGIVLVGTMFVYSLVTLQCFVFNMYHVVMTSIRWHIENKSEKKIEE